MERWWGRLKGRREGGNESFLSILLLTTPLSLSSPSFSSLALPPAS
jgi:hypothetical protein